MILLLLILLDNDIHQNTGPDRNDISIFHLNSRSVRNKLSYLEDLVSDSSICITEGHLDANILDRDILINGFSDTIFRKDRNSFGVEFWFIHLRVFVCDIDRILVLMEEN